MSIENIQKLEGLEFEGDEETQADEAGSQSSNPESSKEDQLKSRLERVEQQTRETSALGQLMADPEIRAILEARQTGKRIKVVQDEQEEQEVKAPENLDELPPSQVVEYTVQKTLQEVSKLLKQNLEPVQRELAGVKGKIQEDLKTGYEVEINKLSEKYKDFKVLVPDMMEINKSTPGLKPEELYVLAKLRRGEGLGALREAEEIETERPMTPVRSTPQKPQGPNAGHAAFQDAMNRALKKTLSRMKPLEIGE